VALSANMQFSSKLSSGESSHSVADFNELRRANLESLHAEDLQKVGSSCIDRHLPARHLFYATILRKNDPNIYIDIQNAEESGAREGPTWELGGASYCRHATGPCPPTSQHSS
jgi:hypothetical protein